MIFTERTIRVSNGTSSISSPIILYKGDKNIKIRFKIVDCPYTYSKNVDNIIETSEASYAQLIIKTPNNGTPILSDITEPENGYVTFIITGEMIDEAKEVGKYSLQVRLLDDEQYGRITIPEVVDGIEVREPMITEGVSTTNEADAAVVDYAVTTAAVAEDAFDSEGNYIETNWQSGNIITSAKLNKIEDGITGVNSQIKDIVKETSSYFEPVREIDTNASIFKQDKYLTGYYIETSTTLGGYSILNSSSGVGKIAVVKIEPNTKYSIVKGTNTIVDGSKKMFAYATDSALFNQGDVRRKIDGIYGRIYKTNATFTSTATDNYLYIYFSDDTNSTDYIQVTKGERTDFITTDPIYNPSAKLNVYSIDEVDEKLKLYQLKADAASSNNITKFYIPSSKAPDYEILNCTYNELPDLTTFYSYSDSLVDDVYVTKTVIGNEGSTNAYPINAYRFKPTLPILANKTKSQVIPKLIITGCIHGSEKPSALALLNLCKNLKDNWVGNEFLTYLRFNVELIVIPILNPYGYVNNRRGNYNHVDLNRNFDHNWSSQGSDNPTNDNYRGTSANSENETQAIINFVNAEKNGLLGHIDVHALGSGDTSWELLYRQEISNQKYEDVFLQIAASNLAATTAKGIAECNVPNNVNTQLGKIGIGYYSSAIDNYFNSQGIISTCCEVAYRYVGGTDYHTDVNKLNTYFIATNIKNFINTFLYL